MNDGLFDPPSPPAGPSSEEIVLPFEYGCFRVFLSPEAPLPLPHFPGSLFRGAFGWALQRVMCVTRTHDCPECFLRDRCLFPYVFETPRPSDSTVMRKYRTVPHPFVLEPPLPGGRTLPAGEAFELGLILVGKSLSSLPYFIFALERMGRHGLGRHRVRCRLSLVQARHAGHEWALYSADDRSCKPGESFAQPLRLNFSSHVLVQSQEEARIQVEFLTPIRLRHRGILARTVPFHVLVRHLLRRVALLSFFHCQGRTEGVPFREWIAFSERVHVVSEELEWFDWERYSSRQRTRMALGGLVGSVTYEGPVMPFLPLLRVGEICHVGKNTTFGLGAYRLLPVTETLQPF